MLWPNIIKMQYTLLCKNFQIDFSLYISKAMPKRILTNTGYDGITSKRL